MGSLTPACVCAARVCLVPRVSPSTGPLQVTPHCSVSLSRCSRGCCPSILPSLLTRCFPQSVSSVVASCLCHLLHFTHPHVKVSVCSSAVICHYRVISRGKLSLTPSHLHSLSRGTQNFGGRYETVIAWLDLFNSLIYSILFDCSFLRSVLILIIIHQGRSCCHSSISLRKDKNSSDPCRVSSGCADLRP